MRVLTKDGMPLKWGSRALGVPRYKGCAVRCMVCHEGVGMACPHGILTKKMIVPPTAVVGWEGAEKS